jgi:hypothetical protein
MISGAGTSSLVRARRPRSSGHGLPWPSLRLTEGGKERGRLEWEAADPRWSTIQGWSTRVLRHQKGTTSRH